MDTKDENGLGIIVRLPETETNRGRVLAVTSQSQLADHIHKMQ